MAASSRPLSHLQILYIPLSCFFSCYVCDIPASSCSEWTNHCGAHHKSSAWRQRRKAHRDIRIHLQASNTVSSVHIPSSVATYYFPRRSAKAKVAPLKEILDALQQVYPVEHPEPAGLAASTRLYTYQKQSLAFMVDIELGRNETQCTLSYRRYYSLTSGKYISSDSSDYDRTLYGPLEAFPWKGVDERVSVQMNARGGILADEVGMGKTLVVISLILQNPCDCKRMSDELWREMTSINI